MLVAIFTLSNCGDEFVDGPSNIDFSGDAWAKPLDKVIEGQPVEFEFYVKMTGDACGYWDSSFVKSDITIGFDGSELGWAGISGTNGATCEPYTSNGKELYRCYRTFTIAEIAEEVEGISSSTPLDSIVYMNLMCDSTGLAVPFIARPLEFSSDDKYKSETHLNLQLKNYIDVSKLVPVPAKGWKQPKWYASTDTYITVNRIETKIPSGVGTIDTFNKDSFNVPLSIRAVEYKSDMQPTADRILESDLVKLNIAVLTDDTKVTLNSISKFNAPSDSSDKELGGENSGDVVKDICDSYQEFCVEGEDEIKSDYSWHIYSVSMNALMTDGNKNDQLEVYLGGYTDLNFDVIDFFATGSPVLVLAGINSNLPISKIPLSNNGVLWLSSTLNKFDVRSLNYDAVCSNWDAPVEMFVGEVGSVDLTIKNPSTAQDWVGDDKLGLYLLSAAKHKTDGWKITPQSDADLVVSPTGPDAILAKDKSVGAGSDLKPSFTVTAPITPIISEFNWQMYYTNSYPFGESCKYRIYVTDRVLPGWRVANSRTIPGTSYKTIVGGIKVNDQLSNSITLSDNAAIVGDPVAIPVSANYEASVKTGCQQNSVSISLIDMAGANIPGTQSYDSTNGRQVFKTSGTINQNKQVRIIISSSKAISNGIGGCEIDDVALYNVDLVTDISKVTTSTFFGDTTAPIGCCPSDECWDGATCVSSKDYSDVSEKMACSNGQWVEKKLKSSFDGIDTNYCEKDTDCYSSVSKECVHDGDYEDDAYCVNGAWTTRTAVVLAQLMKIKGTSNYYSVFCAEPRDALNFLEYKSYNSMKTVAEALDCSSQEDTCKEINNVCVLEYYENNQFKTVLGTSLNAKIDDNVLNGGLLATLGEKMTICNNQMNNDHDYDLCSNGELKIYFDDSTNTTIIMPDETGYSLGTSINTLTAFSSSSPGKGINDGILGKGLTDRFDSLKSLANTYKDTSKGYDGSKYYKFTTDLKHYDNLYYSVWGTKSVFGIIDGYAVEDTPTGTTTIPDPLATPSSTKHVRYFAGIRYSGFASNLCSYIKNVKETVPAEECGMNFPEYGCCYNTKRTSLVSANEYMIISRDDNNLATPDGIFRVFNDLTAKLRLG